MNAAANLSVIISARNEAEGLRKTLAELLASYPGQRGDLIELHDGACTSVL